VSREKKATRHAALGLRYAERLANIARAGEADMFHHRNHWLGLLPYLDFDEPLYFDLMAASPGKVEVQSESRDIHRYGIRFTDKPHKEGSDNLSNICEYLLVVL
jgi:hypothetical protein